MDTLDDALAALGDLGGNVDDLPPAGARRRAEAAPTGGPPPRAAGKIDPRRVADASHTIGAHAARAFSP